MISLVTFQLLRCRQLVPGVSCTLYRILRITNSSASKVFDALRIPSALLLLNLQLSNFADSWKAVIRQHHSDTTLRTTRCKRGFDLL